MRFKQNVRALWLDVLRRAGAVVVLLKDDAIRRVNCQRSYRLS